MIEADSDNALDDTNTPRQNTRLSNFTFIQRSSTIGNLSAILLRGGTDYTLANGVIVSPNTSCLRISRPQTISATVDAAIDEAGAPLVRSVVAQCGTPAFRGDNGVTEAQVACDLRFGRNNNNRRLHADADLAVHQRCQRNGGDGVQRQHAEPVLRCNDLCRCRPRCERHLVCRLDLQQRDGKSRHQRNGSLHLPADLLIGGI